MHIAVDPAPGGAMLRHVDGDGVVVDAARVAIDRLPSEVARRERERPRWVWADTERWYPQLLAAGVRVERCHDLRLCRAILRGSPSSASSSVATTPPDALDGPSAPTARVPDAATLFDLAEPTGGAAVDAVAEFLRQREATTPPLRLLLAAESAGALVAAEIRHAGLPWRADVHRELLERVLGPQPALGARPTRMEAVLEEVRQRLGDPGLNPDSPQELLRALRRAGLIVDSTRSWELEKLRHPAIAPLLEYKKLARLFSANGWHWLEANVAGGRFRPDYVPGGVVTGRWASRGGGGALQLPKQVRGAVVADDGWKLVVADAAQLEPRILAALSRDRGMIEAGSAGDLYAGIVASGAVATRELAKVAMLGAMYGATSGESGRLMPALTRAYPTAIAAVEAAARAGERGERVATVLGRGSPFPDPAWHEAQQAASSEGVTDAVQSRARGAARSWGRFTRNFVVQGTAAEWALSWLGSLRSRLLTLGDGSFVASPHLVFFLHDEVVIHTPAEHVDAVEHAVRAAAADAGRLLFGALPVQFPLTVEAVDRYADAK